jgi:pSer/pThr/pTyr-binding forkhead associated (FHA) protein
VKGRELELAGCKVRVYSDESDVPEETHGQTQQVAFRMVREVMGSVGGASRTSPYVEVLNDDERGQKAKLAAEGIEFLIGRESDCSLILSHWSVSRHHARIVRTGVGAKIEDLGSKNGVMVNEEVVDAPRALSDGDIVFVGHTQVRFHDPSQSFLGQPTDDPPSIKIDLGTSAIDIDAVKAAEEWDAKSPGAEPPEAGGPGAADEEPYPSMRQEGQPSPYSTGTGAGSGSSKAWIWVLLVILLLLAGAAAAWFMLDLEAMLE